MDTAAAISRTGTVVGTMGGEVAILSHPTSSTKGWTDSYPMGYGTGVAVDGSGNIIITGTFSGTLDLGGTILNAAGTDLFIASLGADGAYRWSKGFGGGGVIENPAIAVDEQGKIAVTGSFTGNANFGGNTEVSNGRTDIFVARYDSAGRYVWSKRFGGRFEDEGRGIAFVGDHLVVCGHFQGDVDFGGGLRSNAGKTDIFLASYKADGTPRWSTSFGGNGDDSAHAVTVSRTGTITMTGSIGKGVNFGGGTLTNLGLADIFVASYSLSGSHRRSASFGANLNDEGLGVAVDDRGNVAVAGYFQGAVDFGGGRLGSQYAADIFVLYLEPSH